MTKLPRWKSHKIVLGDKVIEDRPGLIMHTWQLECGLEVNVNAELAARVPPGVDPVGGYYVQYRDGF